MEGLPKLGRIADLIFSLGRDVALLAIFLAVIHTFIATVFFVEGESMAPNLTSDQVLLVNKLAYLASTPTRGDIVVLRFPGDPEKRKFVKRIIGLPGETIAIQDGEVFVNGNRLTEDYLPFELKTLPQRQATLGSDEYYLMGDNRRNSSDSRTWGQARRRDLIGRTKFIIWPLPSAGFVAPVFY
ncbi:signal peptidase I [Candidatus Berkelbacteria bacterium]|nr:signal peptidase I [Candidatus Berkelbacteria bacterium]